MKLFNTFAILSALFCFQHTTYGEDTQFPPKGSTVIEQIVLQNSITEQIKLLDSEKWDDRQKAKKTLLQLIKKNKFSFHYFIITSIKSKNPEVRISSKELLFNYFKQNIYDPNKENGFIGIKLAAAGTIKIKDELYFPIRVVSPVVGFPGAKAGIKTNDLILQIDKLNCNEKFGIPEFIAHIAKKNPGDKIILKLLSNGNVIFKTVTLAKRPESEMGSITKKSVEELFTIWYKEIRNKN